MMSITFAQWQSLSSDQKKRQREKWCVHEQQGLAIVYAVASQFVRDSPVPILDIAAGRGNFDIWFIHAWVSESDLARCTQGHKVDGFEVLYFSGHDYPKLDRVIHFDDWLSLSEDDRDDILMKWNVEAGEGLDVVLRIAANLIEESNIPIVDTSCSPFRGSWSIQVSFQNGFDLQLLPRDHLGIPLYWSEWGD